VGLMLAALTGLALAIAWNPLLLATLAVGLFAGPHNFMEARYLLGRLPRRAGKLQTYLVVSAVGVLGIGGLSLYLALSHHEHSLQIWATLLSLWFGYLCWLRSRENPKRHWPWVEPLALIAAGWIWLSPVSFAIGLVLLHPVMAIIILGRELHFYRRPEQALFPAFVGCVLCGLVVLLLMLTLHPSQAPEALNNLIVIDGPSLIFLAVHAYLETVHYAIWIVVLPALAQVTRRGRLEVYPALKRAPARLWAARGLLALGAVLSCVLWWGFAIDFEVTRDIYFQVAIFHVLVEFPFLLRLV